jgi:hypothetical protein
MLTTIWVEQAMSVPRMKKNKNPPVEEFDNRFHLYIKTSRFNYFINLSTSLILSVLISIVLSTNVHSNFSFNLVQIILFFYLIFRVIEYLQTKKTISRYFDIVGGQSALFMTIIHLLVLLILAWRVLTLDITS